MNTFLCKLLPKAWSPECWSLPYFRDRLKSTVYYWTHPHLPWLTRDANDFLLAHIRSNHRVLEFGAGRSTVFFARHAQSVLSFEDNAKWVEKVTSRVYCVGSFRSLVRSYFGRIFPMTHGKCPVTNGLTSPTSDLRPPLFDLRHLPADQWASQIPDEVYDIILVDGGPRADCTLAALDHLAADGLLIIDNINRYLPNQSTGPDSLRAFDSHNPEHQKWMRIASELESFKQLWTTNGVTDTMSALRAGDSAGGAEITAEGRGDGR